MARNESPGTQGEGRQRRFRALPMRAVVPNMITLLALCAGVSAIRFAWEGRLELAVAAIFAAAVLDALDGRVARLLKSSSRFGAELDSLSDFLCFGVAPPLILFFWTLHDLKSMGWIVALGFAVCAALRLARFNVSLEDPDRPVWAANYFTGVPAPAGAGLVMLPLYLNFLEVSWIAEWPILVALHTAGIAFLLVSRIPTFSAKRMGVTIQRDMVLPLLLVFALSVAMILSYPWTSATVLGVVYLCLIPLSAFRYRQLSRKRPASAQNPLDEDITAE